MAQPLITQLCLVFSTFVIITETINISSSAPNMTVEDVTKSPDGYYYVPVGRTVTLTCKVTSSAYNSSSLVIAQNEISRRNVITPDDATAQVNVTNMAEGPFFLQCCVNSCPSILEPNKIQSRSTVTINYGDPPPSVINVSCVYIDFINLTCSLTINDTGRAVWTLTYCIENYIPTDDKLACPGNITSRSKCDPSQNWTHPDQGLMWFPCDSIQERQVYRVYVDGVNNFGRTSYVTEVDTGIGAVQYSAVNRLRVGPNVTSTSVTLLWDRPVDIYGVHPGYSVTVSQSDWNYREVFRSTYNRCNIVQLRPGKTYHAEVRAKPRSSPHWSEPANVTFTTPEAAPGVPPVLKPGMYTRWGNGVQLMVFWQEVPPASSNGNITHHRVCRYLPNNVSAFCNSSIPADQFHYLLNLPEGTGDCNVTVQAGNNADLSPKSRLRIPKIGEAPQRPLYVTVVQLNDSSYNVSWVLANHNVRLDHVYITWCQGRRTNGEVTCISDVHVEEINDRENTYAVIPNMDPGLRNGVWFGVSTSVEGVSDGTTWNECVFVQDGGVGTPPAMNVLSNASSAWLPLGFSFCDMSLNKGRPRVYEVSYQSTNIKSCFNVNCNDGTIIQETARFDTTAVVLSGLTRPAMYCVCLRVRSALRVGPYSHPPKLLDLSDEPEPVDSAAIAGVTSGLVIMVIMAVLCAVYHRRRLNPLKKIPIDLGMLRTLEGGDFGSADENRVSSGNPGFLDIPTDSKSVSSSTGNEEDVARMDGSPSWDDGNFEIRVVQTEQSRLPADTDSGNASDAAMVVQSAHPAGELDGPEQAPRNTQDKATSESESCPSSGYNSSLNRSKTSRSSTGGSVKLTQVLDHLSEHEGFEAPSKPDHTAPCLLPGNKESSMASRPESKHNIIAVADRGGYVVYPEQVASVRNVELNYLRKKDEERNVPLDYIGSIKSSTDNFEYVRSDVSTDAPNASTDNLEYVRSNVSTDAPNAPTDNLEYVRCNVSTDAPNASTDNLEYVRSNVSTDAPNASTNNLEYVRSNVSTDAPNAPTDNLEYVRCNVSTDAPNAPTDNLEYVRCNVSTDAPNAPTDNLEYVRCNVSTDAPNASTDNLEYVRCSGHRSIA